MRHKAKFSSGVMVWLAAALLLTTGGDAIAQTPRVLTLANEYPATSLPGEGDTAFATRVAALTSGRIEIRTVFDAKSGFKSAEQLVAVRDGNIALGDTRRRVEWA